MIQNTTISLGGKTPSTIVVFENVDFTAITEMEVERALQPRRANVSVAPTALTPWTFCLTE